MIIARDIQNINNILKPLIGFTAWHTYLDNNQHMNIHFVQSFGITDEINEEIETTWHFWCINSAWSIESDTELLTASSDEKDRIVAELAIIRDKKLLSFDVLFPAFEATLKFSDHLILRVFPFTTNNFRHWKLLTPARKMLNIGPGDEWSFEEIHKN